MTERKDLLVEFFGEEIPARMQFKAAEAMRIAFETKLREARLTFTESQSYITPRRLCIFIKGLEDQQPSGREERKGPRVDAPQEAIRGFLNSTGLSLEQCERRSLDKGDFYFASLEKRGEKTVTLLPSLIQNIVDDFVWPKSMRWGHADKMWVRPLHSGICLFGADVVPFDLSFGGGEKISLANHTQGHRFMAPGEFQVRSFEEYEALLGQRFVLLDPQKRRQKILEKASALAQSKGLSLRFDERLLEEVTGLVEWPVVLLGKIDEHFMSLPPEVLITVMRVHQKYFALTHADGTLAPFFILVANLEPTDGGHLICEGNQRVLKARFSDAAFFYELDKKLPFKDVIEKLKVLIFHAELGTMWQKVRRLGALSRFIASSLGLDKKLATRAALLAKADLVTEMVGEFPELQGIMGKYYAPLEDPLVVQALGDHYRPRGPEDPLPEAPLSRALALADKVDTLVGFFGIGIKPTGSKDPYALRRCALGMIRLMEQGAPFTLLSLFQQTLRLYGAFIPRPSSEVLADLMDFVYERLRVYWKDQGIRHDTLNAVRSKATEDTLSLLKKRVQALNIFLEKEEGKVLVSAYRRAAHILRIEEDKDCCTYPDRVDFSLLEVREEKELMVMLEEKAPLIQGFMDKHDFEQAMRTLLDLKPVLDTFFDHVTVNVPEAALRQNRLCLLSKIRSSLETMADFSKIE